MDLEVLAIFSYLFLEKFWFLTKPGYIGSVWLAPILLSLP